MMYSESLGDAVVYTGTGEGDGSELRGGIAFRLEGELQRAVMRRASRAAMSLSVAAPFFSTVTGSA